MKPTTTVAGSTKDRVRTTPEGTFLRRKDFAGSGGAVETALSRLVSGGELVRVRPGVYWVGKRTRFGMAPPSAFETALEVAGLGAGPAGVAAARVLGLTTQVPSVVEVAVPGKAPDPVPGIRFRSRSYVRREHGLTPTEVAVIETLRDPHSSEEDWSEIAKRVSDLVTEGVVRKDVLDEVIGEERHRAARERWRLVAM